jgi:hypothetical protein
MMSLGGRWMRRVRMSAWTCRRMYSKADARIAPRRLRNARRALCRFQREARAHDVDTAVVDSLKELDPERPIREAGIPIRGLDVGS